MTLHPQIIKKEGKSEFVVLPYDEFLKIQEALEDLHDLQILHEAREEHAEQQGTPLREVGAKYNLD